MRIPIEQKHRILRQCLWMCCACYGKDSEKPISVYPKTAPLLTQEIYADWQLHCLCDDCFKDRAGWIIVCVAALGIAKTSELEQWAEKIKREFPDGEERPQQPPESDTQGNLFDAAHAAVTGGAK